jgi:hypothetical protein
MTRSVQGKTGHFAKPSKLGIETFTGKKIHAIGTAILIIPSTFDILTSFETPSD